MDVLATIKKKTLCNFIHAYFVSLFIYVRGGWSVTYCLTHTRPPLNKQFPYRCRLLILFLLFRFSTKVYVSRKSWPQSFRRGRTRVYRPTDHKFLSTRKPDVASLVQLRNISSFVFLKKSKHVIWPALKIQTVINVISTLMGEYH